MADLQIHDPTIEYSQVTTSFGLSTRSVSRQPTVSSPPAPSRRVAHSVAIDQVTHRVFFPLEDVHRGPLTGAARRIGQNVAREGAS
jgi:hypothetical protein